MSVKSNGKPVLEMSSRGKERRSSNYIQLITSIATDLDVLLSDLCGRRPVVRADKVSVDENSDLEQYLVGVDSDSGGLSSRSSESPDNVFVEETISLPQSVAKLESATCTPRCSFNTDPCEKTVVGEPCLVTCESRCSQGEIGERDLKQNTEPLKEIESGQEITISAEVRASESPVPKNTDIQQNSLSDAETQIISELVEQCCLEPNSDKRRVGVPDSSDGNTSLQDTDKLSYSSADANVETSGEEFVKENFCLHTEDSEHKQKLVSETKDTELLAGNETEEHSFFLRESSGNQGHFETVEETSRNEGIVNKTEIESCDNHEVQKSNIPQAAVSEEEHKEVLKAIDMLERLIESRPIWYLPNVRRATATQLLKDQDVGMFMVRKSSQPSTMALSVRVPGDSGTPVEHYLIETPEDGCVRLDGSSHVFPYLPLLIAHYCQYLDELPCCLVLPPVVMNTRSHRELTSLALLGQDFWTSSLADVNQHLKRALEEEACNGDSDLTLLEDLPASAVECKPNTQLSVSDCGKELEALSPFLTLLNFSENQSDTSGTWKSTLDKNCSSLTKTFQKEVEIVIDPAEPTDGVVNNEHSSSTMFHSTNQIDLIQPDNTRYYRGNLSDRISDYEDIWSSNKGPQDGGASDGMHFQVINITDLQSTPKEDSLTFSPIQLSTEHFLKSQAANNNEYPKSSNASSMVPPTQVPSTRRVPSTQPNFFRFDFDQKTRDMLSSQQRYGSPLYVEPADAIEGIPQHVTVNRITTDPSMSDSATESKLLAAPPRRALRSRHTVKEIPVCSGAPSDRPRKLQRVKTAPAQLPRQLDSLKQNSRPAVKTTDSSSDGRVSRGVGHQGITFLSPSGSDRGLYVNTAPGLIHDPPPPSPNQAHQQIMAQLSRESSKSGLSRSKSLKEKSSSQPIQVPEREAQTLPTDIARLKTSSGSETSDSDTLTQVSLQINNFRPRSETMISTYDNVKNVSRDQGVDMLDDYETGQVSLVPPKKSSTVEQNLHDLQTLLNDEAALSPRCGKFPVFSNSSDNSTFTDSSTIADLINLHAPELTVKPLQQLTAKNLQRLSVYDNVPDVSLRKSIAFSAARGSVAFSAVSAGTVFSKPWDNTLWNDLLNLPENEANPRERLPTELNERLQEWKVNRQAQLSLSSPTFMPQPCSPPDTPTNPFPVVNEDRQSWVSGNDVDHYDDEKEDDDYQLVSEMTGYPLRSDATDYQNLSDNVDSGTELGSYSSQENVNSLPRRSQPLMLPDIAITATDVSQGRSFQERLDPFLCAPRLINLRQRDKNHQPGIKIRNYISKLSTDNSTIFGSTVENFIQCTLESPEMSPHVVMRNVRQFMSGIKNYLVKSGEKDLLQVIERERQELDADEFLNIDAIIEGALHKCVVRPLKSHIYHLFVHEYTKNGRLKLLSRNIHEGQKKTPEELGIRLGLNPPQGTSMEVIKHFLVKMQEAYSPLKKLENLLGATSSIYNSVMPSMDGESEVSMGADDFLPMFIYVIVQCGIVSAEIEADYMWGLLHPSLLTGEGGYYLTTLSSAVHVLKNLHYLQSMDSQSRLPAISDVQGFMRIVIPDEKYSSLVAKTLPVRPNMTTKDVCSMLVHKLKITNPQEYSLYKVVAGEETMLTDVVCPQTIRAEHLERGMTCTFVYRRTDANIALPKSLNRHH